MRMSSPAIQRLVFALCGIGLLCLFCIVQLLLFRIPPSLPFFLIPTLIGSLGGLLLARCSQRITGLNHQLQQAHDQLRTRFAESEDRYRRLFRQGATVQLLIDPANGDLVELNDAALNFYGYAGGQQRPASIFAINTDPPAMILANMQRALNLEQLIFSFHHRLRSGAVVPVEVYTMPVPLHGRMLLHSMVIDLSQQDRAEHHLRRKTIEQRLLLDSIPMAVWYLKDAETYGSVNQAFAQYFQSTPQDIAHHRLDEILCDEMLDHALASNRQVFASKQALHYEQWMQRGQMAPQYIAFTKTPKLDDQGEVEFVVCTATDITSTQQAHALLSMERDLHIELTATHSLAESLHLCLRKAIEAAQADCGSLYLVDEHDGSLHLQVHQGFPASFVEATTTYSASSPQAQLVRGNQPLYANCQTLNRWLDLALLRREGIRAIAIVPIAFQDKVIACLNVASHQQEEIASFNRMALERVVAHLGIFLVQKQQAASILQSQRNLATLFNTIRDMVFILDQEGCIIHVNAAVLSRLGYEAGELIGQHVLMMHAPHQHQEAATILNDFLAGTTVLCPLPLLSKGGEEIPVETHLVRGEWSGKAVIFGMSRDIRERLQLEQQRRMLLKSEGLERMAGAIAHHFNNLMAIVSGNVELAREQTGRGTEAFHFLNNALQGSKRAIELGKALLMYTGHFAEQTEPLDLGVLCHQFFAQHMVQLPPTITLEQHIDAQGPRVTANPQQLQRVLAALVTNAIETMGDKPGTLSIHVTTRNASTLPTGHLFPTGWIPEHTSYACLQVGDSGAGIDEQQMASIFDPFYSEKFIGRGLGLPLALSIVKKLGGAICVDSQRSNGSTFSLLLPQTLPQDTKQC